MAIYDTLDAKYQNLFKLLQDGLEEQFGPIREDLTGLSGESKAFLERINQKFQEYETEVKALKLASQRPALSQSDEKQELATKRRAAMNNAMRVGWGRLSAEEKSLVKHGSEDPYARELQYAAGVSGATELKTLYQADGTTGGFLAVPEFINDLIKAIVLVSPMLSVVDVRMTNQPYIMIPKRTQTGIAARVAEQATRTETQNPKFGLVQVFPFESYSLVLVSRTDIDDAEIDLAQFVMDDMSVQFAKLAGQEMVSGTGSGAGQCLGFLNDSSITATTSSVAGSFNASDFTKLIHSLKTGYRQGAVMLGTTETLGQIRGLTDTTGRPLWMPFGSDGATGKIYGYDYIETPDMPQTALNGGSSQALALAFGNFKLGYQAVIRKQMTIVPLMERYADQNAIGYLGYYRFGGTTKLSEAIKLLKCHS